MRPRTPARRPSPRTSLVVAMAWAALGAVAPLDPGAWFAPGARPAAAQRPSQPPRFFGEAMRCDVGLELRAPWSAVIGTRFAVSVTARVSCADALGGAAAVVFVGGRTAQNGPRLAAALGEIRRLLDTTGSPTAVLDAAGPDEAVRWVDAPADRLAAFDAVVQRPPDAGVTGARWEAVVAAASAAMSDLPPSRRPLFIVVDGQRPIGEDRLVETRLAPAARAVRDAAGRTAAIDLSFDGWLADAARDIRDAGFVGLDATIDPTAAIVADGVRQLGDRLHGVFDTAVVEVQWDASRLALVAGSTSPPPSFVGDDLVEWLSAPGVGPVTLRGRADVAASATGPTFLVAAAAVDRAGLFDDSDALERSLCVHAAGGGAADCVPTPEPVATEPTPPSRTPPPPQPTPAATAAPIATAPERLWLPAAVR